MSMEWGDVSVKCDRRFCSVKDGGRFLIQTRVLVLVLVDWGVEEGEEEDELGGGSWTWAVMVGTKNEKSRNEKDFLTGFQNSIRTKDRRHRMV